MPNTRSIQFSFSGGEISPDMYGRVDQKAFQTGLKQCKNAIVRPQGPIKRRPGLAYCVESSNSNTRSRLVQLQTNPQTVMEVKSDHVRFIRDGGLLRASDSNANISYGTVRAYNPPSIVSYAIWSGSTASFRALTGGGSPTAHNYTDGDPVVFSWGFSPRPPSAALLTGSFRYTQTTYLTTSVDFYRNILTLSTADADLIKTGACIVLEQGAGPSFTPWGWAEYSPFYATVNGTSLSLTRMAMSGSNTALPLRRGTYAYNAQPLSSQVTVRAVLSHVDQPGQPATDYNADTQIYYVKVLNATDFQISLTPGGPALALTQWTAPGTTATAPHYSCRVYLAGDCISHAGNNYYVRSSFYGQQTTFDPIAGPHVSKLYNMGASGDLRVGLPVAYTDTQIQQLNYTVSNDIVTLLHNEIPSVDIQRYSDRVWTGTTALNNPEAINNGQKNYNRPRSIILRGARWKPESLSGTSGNTAALLVGPRNVPFVWGDYVIKITSPTSVNPYASAATYVLRTVTYPSTSQQQLQFSNLDGTLYGATSADVGYEYEPVPSADFDTLANTYKISHIDVNGIENFSTLDITQYHNLSSRGAAVYLVWPPQPNAVQYRIYKAANGIYGWVGDTNNSYWVDENYDADLAQRPVLYDISYQSNGVYGQAGCYFEQRRVYGGATLYPSRIWMTRSNTLYDFGYSIPVKDTDRIVIEMAARQTERIRHLLPLSDLMVLTDQGEWQLSPVNSDVITPTTISVRKQSNFGANYTVPVTIGQSGVYVTARGGHAREIGYNNDQRGYVTGDLSLRAAHLFDGKDLIDLDCIKSPFPVLWFVSTDGKLKALTYIPDEKIYAWHEHETDGVFESAAAITEGANDVLYAVVRRTINGQTKRYIERLAPLQEYGDTNVYLDSSLSGDGTNTTATTMRLSQVGQQGWTVGSTVTVTRSSGTFVNTDVGDYLVMYDAAGLAYRVEIMLVGSPATTAQARIIDELPLAIQDVATTSWAFARDQWSGLSHLEGKTVSIWADGVMQTSKVVAAGSVTLDTPAIKVRIGLPYTTTIQTLPIALQADAFGQGRTKNVNKVWVRVQGTEEFKIGPTTSDLVSSRTLPSGQTDGELQVTLLPAWSQDGSIVMQQSDAFPMNINGLTLEAAIGS